MRIPTHSPNQRRSPPVRVAIFISLTAALAMALAMVVMLLWNAVLVPALHAGPLDYWQALGLLVLCRILFGNFRPGRSGAAHSFGPGPGLREKWSQMTPEQRTGFRDHWQRRRQASNPSANDNAVRDEPRDN